MFHAATAPLAHYASLRSGDQCFIAKRFELELCFRFVEEHQITEGAFVPPMVAAIINSPLKEKYSLQSIRIAHSGAAPLDRWSQEKLQALLHPDCPITQVWDMTETSCTCSLTPWP
jgi:non-ribosomal peptide synthetase component E (peptide arylation enzyme)